MPENTEEEKLEMPAHLDDLKGTKSEITAQKSALISKFGIDKWTELVARSGKGTKR